VKYAFIKAQRREFDTAIMCRLLDVSRSGFYEWLRKPLSDRALEDQRLFGLIRAAYTASHGQEKGSPISKAPVKRHSTTSTRHSMDGAACEISALPFSLDARETQPHPLPITIPLSLRKAILKAA
jgi:hypothetical protein